MTEAEKNRLLALMVETKFPTMPQADWENTNHYELNGVGVRDDRFFWFCLGDLVMPNKMPTDNEPIGKQVGLLLDLAVVGAKFLRGEL
jgi:hypothetical protein